MSHLLSCASCQTPVARLDLARYPLAATACHCPRCARAATIDMALAAA